MKGLSIKNLVSACNGLYHGDESYLDREISSITTDSRQVEKDGLFAAIKGERSDGHKFIGQCFEKGALVCISELELEGETRPYIQVESTITALRMIAKFYREQMTDLKVVAISGSAGKTSTKETIASVLEKKYKVLKTEGNFNNDLGVPLTVFRLKEDDQVAVIELGISHFGDMEKIASIVSPDICVITNIGQCHLENLKTRDGILEEKTDMFRFMKDGGYVVLNGDDDKLSTVGEVKGRKPYFFGIDSHEGAYATDIKNLGLKGMKVEFHQLNPVDGLANFAVSIPIPGRHMVYNALAAATVASILGLSSDQIIAGISDVVTLKGRNNLIEANGLCILDDCYNANPGSMRASIDVLDASDGRKVAILGDMFELGKEERELHYEVGRYLAYKKIDELVAIGNLAKSLADGASDECKKCDNKHLKVTHYDSKADFFDNLNVHIQRGDNVLVKSSHGMNFAEIVEKLSHIDY